MKLKKTILGLAVVAVAGVNAFNALSDGQFIFSNLQMENIEALASNNETYQWVHLISSSSTGECSCLDPGTLKCESGSANF